MDIDDVTTLLGAAPRVGVEATSVLHQPEPLVLHLDAPPPPAVAGEAATVLRTLPTVTVVVGDPDVVPAALVDAVDVCLTEVADPPRPWVHGTKEQVEAAVAAQPLPALALASLLRGAETASPWERIVAEAATYGLLLGSAGFSAWRAANPVRSRGPRHGEVVHVTRSGDRLEVELDRPESRNAISTEVRDQLVEALALPLADPRIVAISLRGNGPAFCSGGDLDEFGTVGDPATSFAVRLTRHPGLSMHRVADRTTVHLHGACIGAGIEIAAFAHEVIAAPDTVIGLPELSMGLIPGAGGTVSLPARIGRHRTAWLALTGVDLPADDALRWGLVDSLAPIA